MKNNVAEGVENKDDNIIDIRSARSLQSERGSPPKGGGRNYLKALPVGTVFIAQPINDKGWQLAEFEVATKGVDTALLEMNTNDGTFIMWVHQAMYCNSWNLIEIIRVP